jgi:hypothetical protein
MYVQSTVTTDHTRTYGRINDKLEAFHREKKGPPMNILQQSTYVLVYNPSKQNAIDE